MKFMAPTYHNSVRAHHSGHRSAFGLYDRDIDLKSLKETLARDETPSTSPYVRVRVHIPPTQRTHAIALCLALLWYMVTLHNACTVHVHVHAICSLSGAPYRTVHVFQLHWGWRGCGGGARAQHMQEAIGEHPLAPALTNLYLSLWLKRGVAVQYADLSLVSRGNYGSVTLALRRHPGCDFGATNPRWVYSCPVQQSSCF